VKKYGEVPPVRGSGQRLGQVFLNLLINAAEAIPIGNPGKNCVTIHTSATDADGAGSVTVEIRDTGAGIPRELLGHVFEPLFTTKPEGTGLGLAISRALLTEQGGSISVESEPEKGTVFRVVLRPSARAAARASSVRHDGPRERHAHSEGKRILIVDDEPRLANVLRLVLSTHLTTLAASGGEALERLRSGEVFDAIVSDLWIGDVDGISLYEQIRKAWPGLERRVIFMSGDASSPRSSAFFRSIANRVIEKPFESQALLDAVDNVVEAP
jgi:CheY-like chemotaxis protein